MEQAQQFYGLAAMGRKNMEWNMNSWKWDGDLFIASPLDPASVPSNFRGQQFIPIPVAGQSSNSSSSCSEDLHQEIEVNRGITRDLDRKRRVIVVDEEDEEEEEAGSLSLKLGGYPSLAQSQAGFEGSLDAGKKAKLTGSPSSRAVCQVEGCGTDLASAKDYHRRHKVCEIHSKAPKAFVGNTMQRFCQQCSRFHALQEFDEGKRSCRRRLAGHNKRRRKTQPDPAMAGPPANDEQASNYILISLLRLLSNMHYNNRSDLTADNDMVAHLMRSLASQSGSPVSNDLPGLLHESQKLLNCGISGVNPENISAFLSGSARPPRPTNTHQRIPASEAPHKTLHTDGGRVVNVQAVSPQKPDTIFLKGSPPTYSEVRDSPVGRAKLNNFDLNDIYIDSDDGVEDLERSPATGSVGCRSWTQPNSLQSSPPQISGNSDSASAQSPSSSSGEAQSRTDRIVFKLFGKEPSEFPMVLRGQVLDWLAHSPTDMESYIRPGCVILTIYLRLAEPMWEELSSNLGSSLSRLLDITDEPFWQTGWVYTRVENQIVFFYNGQIVVNTSLPYQDSYSSRISSVSPVAVSISELAHFQIKGSRLSGPSTRLLCALEGKYLDLKSHEDLITDGDDLLEDDEIECLNLSCSIPSVTGRGFIEVEDHGLSSSFFPFIVAEKDVCSEIRTLESLLDPTNFNRNWEAKHQAMDFIHEMGWLLHRCQLNSRLGHQNPNTDRFSFKRFRWLMEFSMDHDWCAVVRKLLDILLEGSVSYGEHPSLAGVLSEMGLLHRAVRRNCAALVDLLLRFVPASSAEDSSENFLFTPDVKGPAGLTPLHIAAGKDGSEAVLDALTNDPGQVGIKAWKGAQDSTGSTPEDYARLRGHYAYIHLVERKIRRTPSMRSVVVDIPEDAITLSGSKRVGGGISSLELATSLSLSLARSCKACERKVGHPVSGRSRVYRPAMLSMVAVAAVCVCVALFFKTSPVVYIFQPFRWESLDFGTI